MRYSPRQLSVGAIVALLLSLAVGLSHAGVLFRRAAFEVVRASATIAASAPTVTCTQPPPLKPCINFWVNASKLYPFLEQDSVLNMAQQAQPFQFALPARLPVTRGNSGNYLSTITIDSATVMSSGGNDNAIGIFVSQVVCQYKGTGVQNPQLPEEITAAQNYAFQSCSPSNLGLQAGT